MVNIKNKGANFERKVMNMFRDDLGVDAQRNLMQSARGGDDLVGVPFFSIELKKHDKKALGTWWKQCLASAEQLNKVPVLMYQLPRKNITIVMRLGDLVPVYEGTGKQFQRATCRLYEDLVELNWIDFIKVFRYYVHPSLDEQL